MAKMIDTIFGTKHELSQGWNKAGFRMPITVIKTSPMTVVQVKDRDKDGYQAIQIGFGDKKWKHTTKPLQGHFKKALKTDDKNGAKSKSKLAPRFLREVRLMGDADKLTVGDIIAADKVLTPGDIINATGTSRGRGFAGVIKRWGFHGGPRTHGQSDRERAPGSIGQGTDPGRVHKGKKMPGHYGNATVTVRNLTVVKIDSEKNELWLKGQVPGARNSLVSLRKIGHDKKFTGLFDPELDKLKATSKKAAEKKPSTKSQDKPSDSKSTTPEKNQPEKNKHKPAKK